MLYKAINASLDTKVLIDTFVQWIRPSASGLMTMVSASLIQRNAIVVTVVHRDCNDASGRLSYDQAARDCQRNQRKGEEDA